MNANATQATDIVEVESLTVACDGGTPALGHPKVFLHIEPEEGSVVCPYCSRQFKLKEGADLSGGH